MTDGAHAAIDILRDIFFRNRDEIFLIDVGTGKEFTYRDIEHISKKIASFLLRLGVVRGDRVAFLLPNSIEGSLLYFSCMNIGAVIVPINQRLLAEEITSILAEAGPTIMITTPMLLKEKQGIVEQNPDVRVVTIPVRCTADAKALQDKGTAQFDFWAEVERNKPFAERSFHDVGDEDMLALIYTSGTTSKPKGILVRFDKLIRNGLMFARLFKIPRGVRFLGTFSQGYLGGLYNTLLFQFLAEGSVALDAGFTPDVAMRFWDTVEKFNVTALWPAPSMLAMILAIDRGQKGETYAPRHIKYVFTGTAPLGAPLKAAFEKRYGVLVCENYALSETFFISTNTENALPHKGVGTVVPGCHVSVLGENGVERSRSAPGEIVVESEYMATGYYGDPDQTKAQFRGGKFYTGDVGYMDADGYLFVTDRKKDIIIRGGINVSPKEIEEVIAQVGGVREVAVVGLMHSVSGEEIVAAVVGNDSLHANEILLACSKHLAPFKVPSRIFFVRELPKAPTGKVQKQKVKELVQELAARPQAE